MMGLYRFLLAQAVLLSHFGGLSSESSRVAVYSFYTISGFLIFRVLDTKYMTSSGAGLLAFYTNRILRIFPLFILLLIIAGFLAQTFNNGFDNGPGEARLFILKFIGNEFLWSDIFFFIPIFDFDGLLPVMRSSDSFLPQVWSVGIELYCYLCAPFILLWAKDNFKRWSILVFLLGVYFIIQCAIPHPNLEFNYYVYKNFFPGLFMFVIGGCIWQLKKRSNYVIDGVLGFFVLVFYFWYLFFWCSNMLFGHEITPFRFFADVIVSIPVTALVIFTSIDGTLKKISDQLGELSYGIYLNQYIVAFVMMLANSFFARTLNWSTIFGAGYNRLEFGIHAMVFSAIFAYVTYITIEQSVEKIRRRIGSSK